MKRFIFPFSFTACLVFTVLLIFTGCSSHEEGWKTTYKATAQGDVKQMLASASELEKNADTKEKITGVIDAYGRILEVDPANFAALSKLGEFSMLYGYIYSNDKNVKAAYYTRSMSYCERAMYTNPAFKALAEQGKPVWEAVSALGEREMTPMFYWYVSFGNYWNDCLGLFGKLVNFKDPGRDKLILDRMTEVKPDWMQGLVPMSWGTYYSIVPGSLGGDLTKAADSYNRALQLNPDSLVTYYVRARYLQTAKKDKENFRKDLNYILSKDPRKVNMDFPWAAAYKFKAKELLSEEGNFF